MTNTKQEQSNDTLSWIIFIALFIFIGVGIPIIFKFLGIPMTQVSSSPYEADVFSIGPFSFTKYR